MEEEEGELGECHGLAAGSPWDTGPTEGRSVVGNVGEEKVTEAQGAGW